MVEALEEAGVSEERGGMMGLKRGGSPRSDVSMKRRRWGGRQKGCGDCLKADRGGVEAWVVPWGGVGSPFDVS